MTVPAAFSKNQQEHCQVKAVDECSRAKSLRRPATGEISEAADLKRIRQNFAKSFVKASETCNANDKPEAITVQASEDGTFDQPMKKRHYELLKSSSKIRSSISGSLDNAKRARFGFNRLSVDKINRANVKFAEKNSVQKRQVADVPLTLAKNEPNWNSLSELEFFKHCWLSHHDEFKNDYHALKMFSVYQKYVNKVYQKYNNEKLLDEPSSRQRLLGTYYKEIIFHWTDDDVPEKFVDWDLTKLYRNVLKSMNKEVEGKEFKDQYSKIEHYLWPLVGRHIDDPRLFDVNSDWETGKNILFLQEIYAKIESYQKKLEIKRSKATSFLKSQMKWVTVGNPEALSSELDWNNLSRSEFFKACWHSEHKEYSSKYYTVYKKYVPKVYEKYKKEKLLEELFSRQMFLQYYYKDIIGFWEEDDRKINYDFVVEEENLVRFFEIVLNSYRKKFEKPVFDELFKENRDYIKLLYNRHGWDPRLKEIFTVQGAIKNDLFLKELFHNIDHHQKRMKLKTSSAKVSGFSRVRQNKNVSDVCEKGRSDVEKGAKSIASSLVDWNNLSEPEFFKYCWLSTHEEYKDEFYPVYKKYTAKTYQKYKADKLFGSAELRKMYSGHYYWSIISDWWNDKKIIDDRFDVEESELRLFLQLMLSSVQKRCEKHEFEDYFNKNRAHVKMLLVRHRNDPRMKELGTREGIKKNIKFLQELKMHVDLSDSNNPRF